MFAVMGNFFTNVSVLLIGLSMLVETDAVAMHLRPRRITQRSGLQETFVSLREGSSMEVNVSKDNRPTLKEEYPFYHTTQEIKDTVNRLAGSCKNAELTVRTESEDDVDIDVVRVRSKTASPVNKVFILSGEHARELIGPESTLRFLRGICGDDTFGSDRSSGTPNSLSLLQKFEGNLTIAEVLQDSEFEVVLIGNPKSRLQVEKGNYCVRSNENGVDLNRNWDEQWSLPMTMETDKGPNPFSEPETRIFKRLVEAYQPTTFLSVHSGTLGMYMPWAWSKDQLAGRNQDSMMDVLKSLDRKHCKCPFGAAGKEVGYSCPGTSVDWVYDKMKASYSFAFEIWGDVSESEHLRKRWEEKFANGGAALLQEGHHLGHPHFSHVFETHPSDFVHGNHHSKHALKKEDLALMDKQTALMDLNMCFGTFNPKTAKLYEETLKNWATAYIEMAAITAKDLKAKQNASA